MDILCPVCHEPLIREDKVCRCINRHSFDLAKEGYLNLNRKRSDNTGDNAEMIRARRDFLDQGYYAFLKDAVNRLVSEEDALVDLACGEGYYTSCFKASDKVGIDLAKTGLKIASKRDKSTLYLLSSIFRCPLPDGCADKVITIFAPIAAREIVRLLKDEGRFILVRPDREHLYELKQAIYDRPYYNDAQDVFVEGLQREKQLLIKQKALVKKEDLMHLFMMTPYWNTTSQADKAKLADHDDLNITFAFIIDVFKKS